MSEGVTHDDVFLGNDPQMTTALFLFSTLGYQGNTKRLLLCRVASYDGGSMSTIVQVPYEVPSVARPVMDPRTFDALW